MRATYRCVPGRRTRPGHCSATGIDAVLDARLAMMREITFPEEALVWPRLPDDIETVIEQRVAQRTHELREIVAGLETFNRNISHDLRNPLAGIAGLARLADQSLSSGDTAAVERLLPAIATEAEAALELVSALLSLARAGSAPLATRSVRL